MKKLRFFGLLVTVLLLAFGLTIACDNGTTKDDSEPVITGRYVNEAQGVEIIFSDKPLEARARQTGLATGNAYVIKRNNQEISKGTIQLLDNNRIRFIPSTGDPFEGTISNSQLTITGAGAPLTVIANVPGTSSGGGSGGGTGGGGTGGGGGSTGGATPPVTLPDIPAVITYTVVTAGGNLGDNTTPISEGAGDTTLVFSFDEPVEGLRTSDVTITKGNPGNIELAGTVGSDLTKKIWTFDLVATSAVQGQVTVSITKNKVDPDPRSIAVNGPNVLGAPELIKITEITLWKGQNGAMTTQSALFKVTTDTLKIELSTAAAITVDNIGWNTNLDPYGLKAEIAKPTNLRVDPNNDKVYWANVNVIKQGSVEFFMKGRAEKKEATDLMGAAFDPAIQTAAVLTSDKAAYAAKNEPMQYNVKAANGNKNNETTTTLTFTFAYDPTVFDTEFAWTGAITPIGIVKTAKANTAQGYWEKGGGPDWAVDPDNPRVYTLTFDDSDNVPLHRTREGFVDVKISQFGFATDTKTVEVHRKPLVGYTVQALQTVGITTHLLITFDYDVADDGDPNDTSDWEMRFEDASAGGDGFDWTKFLANDGDESNILVKTSKGRVLANQTLTASNTIVPFVATDFIDDAWGLEEVDGIRYLLKLEYPILPNDAGGATVTITGTTSDHPTHPELTDKPQPVTLVHGGLVKYSVSAATNTGTTNAATLTIDFDQPLFDPYTPTHKPNEASPTYSYLDVSTYLKITDWDFDWKVPVVRDPTATNINTSKPTVAAGQPLTDGSPASQLQEGIYTVTLAGNGLVATTAGTTAAPILTAPISVTIANPDGDVYEYYLIDPNPVPGTFTFIAP
jgi:hypothetical protein